MHTDFDGGGFGKSNGCGGVVGGWTGLLWRVPVAGKMINARDKMTTTKGLDQMYANEEMSNLKKILGLNKARSIPTNIPKPCGTEK